MPKLGMIGGCSSCKYGEHRQGPIEHTHRILPQNKIAGIAKAQVTRFMQAFTDITTFSQLSSSLVLLLLRSANLAKSQFDIRGKLKSGTVK